MPRPGVVIHLSPTWLEVAVCSGRKCVRVERTDLEPSDWPDLWQRKLHTLDTALAQLLQRAGVRSGARADVVYQSPDTDVELHTVQARGADALAAARLSIAQGAGDSRDRASLVRVLAAETAGGVARTHVLCASDSEHALGALARWLTNAGLVPARFVACEAIEVSELTERFRAGIGAGAQPASIMFVGEHRTVIASGEPGSLRCVRTLDFGYTVMVDAMARAGRAAELHSLSPGALRRWAADALFHAGIPKRGQTIDEKAQVRAEHALPLLQPVLQRYAVEIKQTLRFVMGDAGLVRSSLILTGPGAAIPGLAPVLTGQIEIPVTADSGAPRSMQDTAAAVDLAPFSLVPRAEAQRRHGVAFKRAMLTGAGVAALLIAADAAQTFREQYRVHLASEDLMHRLIDVRRDIEMRRQAADLARRVEAQEQTALESVGDRPDWSAFLDELGALTTGKVRLTDLQANVVTNGYTASIHGVADIVDAADRAAGTPDPLAGYIERLQRSPMIEGVDLGSTRLGEYEGAAVKHFTITARLVAMPARLAGAETPGPRAEDTP